MTKTTDELTIKHKRFKELVKSVFSDKEFELTFGGFANEPCGIEEVDRYEHTRCVDIWKKGEFIGEIWYPYSSNPSVIPSCKDCRISLVNREYKDLFRQVEKEWKEDDYVP